MIEKQKANTDYQACEFYPKWTCSKKVKAWDCKKCLSTIEKINSQIAHAWMVRHIGDKNNEA